MRINNVGLNLGQKSNNPFKTSRNSTTNPFQNVSFEGNTLPYADVFVAGIESQKTNKLKMIVSSVVGSMTKNSAFESVVNFVNRIGERISNAWTCVTNVANKKLFTLPGEEACRKAMNTDIVDIGKGIANSASDLGKVLNKDALEVGKEISEKVANDLSNKMSIFANAGNGIHEKWNSLISNVKINHAPKISKDMPVSELKERWILENNAIAGREAA